MPIFPEPSFVFRAADRITCTSTGAGGSVTITGGAGGSATWGGATGFVTITGGINHYPKPKPKPKWTVEIFEYDD